ncbi:helix-turn-helix transcriptional regulator [Kutzneria sp. CA-103260]|uniref:helix-turn-helix transcriptional regulator n=1 Tax=Kutzneria sp. CA-103260 TaxID=2802641 RepID=UPI002738547E|nr:LuxR C-terminal-related transcriptional regulator [Kutzneria sp. CA-103260]
MDRAGNRHEGRPAVESATTERPTSRGTRFAATKFRPAPLPTTLVTRSALHDRLLAGASQRLTLVVGAAGTGKSLLLASWAAARPAGLTSWLSCDVADTDPVRFWAGFIEAIRVWVPWFGAEAAGLLAMDEVVLADVTASIVNDAANLPAESAIVVDEFQYAAGPAARDVTTLVERWPAETVQLVLASRMDPPLRLHRLRMTGELCELRDRDLRFSLAESGHLLANFGVQVASADLALLHQRSEGWAAALQMAALSLRGTSDPAWAARAPEVLRHATARYFVEEVLEQQPAEAAQFMLDTSVLSELTADACAVVTGRHDAATLLHSIDAANVFLVALDEERTSFRYHHLVRQLLRARLRARDRGREQQAQLQAGEWFESTGDVRRAARHLLAAKQADRAVALLRDRVFTGFQSDPTLLPPLDLSMIAPSRLVDAPDRLLGLATDLLLSGDSVRGGEYLDLLERAQPAIPPDSELAARLAAAWALRWMLTGQADEAAAETLAARAAEERTRLRGDWNVAVPMVLLRAYTWLEDYEAVEREAAAALAAPEFTEPVKLVLVPGARAVAWLEAGHLAQAADAARTAEAEARRLGFGQHLFAVDCLRALAGLALERRDLDAAEHLTEQALSISERRRPAFQFLALLDQAGIWAARGQVREALTSIEAARLVLAGTESVLLAHADELEALLRLSLGDPSTPTQLAGRLPAVRRAQLLAQIALAAGDHHTAQQHLQSPPGKLTPRRALIRQLLLAATAISRSDPMTVNILAGALHTARLGGFCNTVVATAPQVTEYLVGHWTSPYPDPFTERLTAAAREVRAAQPHASWHRRRTAEPLTPAELRVLKLLPTSTYAQIAAALYVSRGTVKTHLQSVYRKLGVTSRTEAIEWAVNLRLL